MKTKEESKFIKNASIKYMYSFPLLSMIFLSPSGQIYLDTGHDYFLTQPSCFIIPSYPTRCYTASAGSIA